MRYRFWGKRETGEPVEGYMKAISRNVACNILSENGIIADSLMEEPATLDASAATSTAPRPASERQCALDQVRPWVCFDYTVGGYQAMSPSAVEKEKAHKHVMELVDDGVIHNVENNENRPGARCRSTDMLELEQAPHPPNLGFVRSPWLRDLDRQVSRLTGAVERIEEAMASMAQATRRVERRTPRRDMPASRDSTHADVLAKIFESNLELVREMEKPE